MADATMRAIETRYHRYRFRSRLEARWAVALDVLSLPWEYEKEGYNLGPAGSYLPDFWLPTVTLRSDPRPGLWLEIKGQGPTEVEAGRCEALARVTGYPVVLFVGLPGREWEPTDHTDSGYQYQYEAGTVGGPFWWDNCMSFLQCHACRHVKVEYRESNYEECPKCGRTADGKSAYLLAAYELARSARFEHGEAG